MTPTEKRRAHMLTIIIYLLIGFVTLYYTMNHDYAGAYRSTLFLIIITAFAAIPIFRESSFEKSDEILS